MLKRRFRILREDIRAVSAVEFALVLPVMLALLVGMAEMAHAVDGWRKLTRLARAVADLTSQGDSQDPIASATMNGILAASSSILRPFSSGNVKIVVSALGIDTAKSQTNPRVCSSVATSNAAARPTGIAGDLKIPAGLNLNGARLVLAEVTMPYVPMLGSTLVNLFGGTSGAIMLKASFPWPVRHGVVHNSVIKAPEVTMPQGSPCP